MHQDIQPSFEDLESLSPWAVFGFLGAMVLGVVAALKLVPVFLPAVSFSLAGNEPQAYWFLARASAFVAFTMIAASMVFGLLITNKMARIWPGGAAAVDLHEHFTLLGLGFALFHALVLLGDRYIGYTLTQVLLPFSGSSYRPLWVGIGQVCLYLLALVTLSFYIRKPLGHTAWRAIHYLSFAVFLMALAHGVLSGTDTTQSWVKLYYQAMGAGVLFLTIYRVLIRPGSIRRAGGAKPAALAAHPAPVMPASGTVRPRQVVAGPVGVADPESAAAATQPNRRR
jgi:predicted ferric reductase